MFRTIKLVSQVMLVMMITACSTVVDEHDNIELQEARKQFDQLTNLRTQQIHNLASAYIERANKFIHVANRAQSNLNNQRASQYARLAVSELQVAQAALQSTKQKLH